MTGQNGIRVEDMLNMRTLKSSKLVAGFKSIGNTVSTVNIVADPDIMEWVQAGEFLLTTAYYFSDDNVNNFKNLIRKGAYNNLAGLGIKIKPYMEKIPEDIIKLSEELDFPLIVIDENVPLSDIMMPVSKEIFKKQASLLDRIESIHSNFTTAILDGSGVEEIINIVQKNIKNPTVLCLNHLDKLETSFGSVSENSKKILLEEVQKFNKLTNGINELKRVQEDKILHNGKFIKRIIVPIILKDNIYGHIFTWSLETPLGGFDTSILEAASTTISLSVLQELSIKEVEIRYRSEIFEDLISQDEKRREKALERAHFLNLSLDSNYVVEVMSFKYYDSEKAKLPIYEELKNNFNMMVITIEELMEYFNIKGIVSTKLNGIQILINIVDVDTWKELVKKLNKKIIETLEKKYPNIQIHIGVGRQYEGLKDMNKSFQDSIKAIRTGKLIMEKNIIIYDELGIYKILSQESLKDELKDFYETILSKLVEYDRKKSTDLIKTLEAYFEYNGNLTRMSENLYTHYNTILYRINRINEITGMSLENAEDRLNLEIALKIRKLI